MSSNLSKVLCSILNKKRTSCCLCFKTLEEENCVTIRDEIFFDNSPNLLKISELLRFLLGTEIINTIELFDSMCNECAADAIRSYSFVKMCKENCEKLYSSLQSLSRSFTNTLDDLPYIKSVFVSLNIKDFTTNKHYDCKQLTTKGAVCKRFVSLCRNKYKKNNIAIKDTNLDTWADLTEDNCIDNNTTEGKVKKSKKPRCTPVDVPLHEVLLNINDPQDLKCKVCLETRTSLSMLKQHYLRAHAPKIFKCPDCPRKYGSPAILNQHRNDNHLNVVCSQCGKTFHSRTNLKAHELTHKQVFVCTECGRTYKSINSYKCHIKNNRCGLKNRRSNAEATYACDKCDKKYTHKASLTVHYNFAHGDGKSFTCSWCDKKFDAPSRLKSHIVKHTKEKNFTCDLCDGKFVTKESLIYHRRIHTGEKPYACEHCDKRFLNTSRRAEHVRRRHLAPSFACALCPRKFKTRSCLLKHKSRHFNPSSKLHCAQQSFDDHYQDVENV